MKLIDLLVKELPKRGGWPDGAEYCHLTQYDRHCLTIVFSHRQVGTGNNSITSKEEMVFFWYWLPWRYIVWVHSYS